MGAASVGIERDFRGGSSRGYCPGMGTLMLMVRLFHKQRPAGDSPHHNKKLWTPESPSCPQLGLTHFMIIRWLSRKTITRAFYSIANVLAALHGVSRYDWPALVYLTTAAFIAFCAAVGGVCWALSKDP
jgi:hypothetical protein